MVFWIIIALITVGAILTFIYWWMDLEYLAAFGVAFLVLMGGGIAGLIIVFLFMLIPASHVESTVHPLRALGDSSSVQGEFFLGSGYVGGAEKFNYVEQDPGYSMLLTANARASRVYENASRATVVKHHTYYANGWVLPWRFVVGTTYDFHVPKGTVQTNYSVTTK